MYSHGREMIAFKVTCVCAVLLSLHSCLASTNPVSAFANRRRLILSSQKQSIEDATQKSETIPDQLAQAASRQADANKYRRTGAYASDNENDFPYGNPDQNLIRPENESTRRIPHTQITTQSTSTIYTASADAERELDETETAEEYVNKAMRMAYGARLKEPIRIPSETPEEPAAPNQEAVNRNRESSFQPRPPLSSDPKLLLEAQLQAQLQVQMNQAKLIAEQEAQAQEREKMSQEMQQERQQQQQKLQQQQQAQQQQQIAQQQAAAYESQTEQSQNVGSSPVAAALVYDGEPVTRSYQVHDDAAASFEGTLGEEIDRQYRTKYHYQPVSYRDGDSERVGEEKLRVSASTEIPKAEIMKQIEKSVIRYMKELEAEGKIIASPQEPKSYYKVVTVPASEEKRVSSTTLRPKYAGSTSVASSSGFTSSTPGYAYSGSAGASAAASSVPASSSSGGSKTYYGTRHHMPKHSVKQYQSETETAYQAPNVPQSEVSDALAPNVEFIYKIKTRAPLQTATVKTVSKPYSLPLKSSTYELFDHSAALKNIEDFDLSHVVTTQEPDDRPQSEAQGANKPSKLYFNSEIYHDINSLPYKPEKTRLTASDYRKIKAAAEQHPELRGAAEGGYFAEPNTDVAEKEQERQAAALQNDDGYPVVNPYQFLLKKELLPSKYDEAAANSNAAGSSTNWEQPQRSKHANNLKALEYDSYSPKFNNNPEGYGYQHTYKLQLSTERERERERDLPLHKYSTRHLAGKRGKRGGPHPQTGKKKVLRNPGKDLEASLALRPPPKV